MKGDEGATHIVITDSRINLMNRQLVGLAFLRALLPCR